VSKYTESFESYAGSIRGSTTFKDVFNHQQTKIDERDARIAELEKENRYLRMSLNRLYGEVSNGEHLDKDWIKETLKSVPYDRFTEALQGRIKNLQSKLELAVEGLRFYAEEGNWYWESGDSNKTQNIIEDIDVQYCSIFRDGVGGKRARAYFKKYEGKNG
jgi:hypothetical protein